MPETPTREMRQILTQANKLEEMRIPAAIVTDLINRILFSEGDVSVSRFADIMKVSNQIIDEVLTDMQQERLVEVAKAGQLGRMSYSYRLTDEGMKRARDAMDKSTYIGPAPVPLEDYNDVVLLQAAASANKRRITPDAVRQALGGLVLPENFHRKIGPALNAGSSLFLYGPPGNGKTTVAEICARLLAGTEPIWMPYAVTVGGQIIQVFDPLVHEAVEVGQTQTERLGRVDRRWALIKRPAVMVGGELVMDSLDLRFEPIAKFYEAPLQMKANGGMFLIDDFGRQQISPQQLLNRWIVPLESRKDFLRLQSGQTVEVPFQQLIVFSTNLDPTDLTDSAFLRRIQMKVEVKSPDEKMFYQIFGIMCKIYKLQFDKDVFLHLLNRWYRSSGRVMQSVHPRDILKTVISICEYEGMQPRLTPQLVDEACESYFVSSQQ